MCFTVVGQARVGGWVPMCDSMQSWIIYSAASLGYEATGTMTSYPAQSHYPDADQSLPDQNNAKCQTREPQV